MFVFLYQGLPTAVPPQIQTVQCSQLSKRMTPLLFSTWRLTPRSTILYMDPTSKPCWTRLRRSRRGLKPPWCSERARYQRERTQNSRLAAILSVAPNPAAAAVDGTKCHSCLWRQCGKVKTWKSLDEITIIWLFCSYAFLLVCGLLIFSSWMLQTIIFLSEETLILTTFRTNH